MQKKNKESNIVDATAVLLDSIHTLFIIETWKLLFIEWVNRVKHGSVGARALFDWISCDHERDSVVASVEQVVATVRDRIVSIIGRHDTVVEPIVNVEGIKVHGEASREEATGKRISTARSRISVRVFAVHEGHALAKALPQLILRCDAFANPVWVELIVMLQAVPHAGIILKREVRYWLRSDAGALSET